MSCPNPASRQTFIVGHQRPDTNSAVSAVVYATFLDFRYTGTKDEAKLW
jgi:inorganic pyrophosphatase/exopolyphosphatase